jgi:5'-3' exoribonuclease 1
MTVLCIDFPFSHALQDIADGSLNLMMNTYRDILPGLGGYLTQKNSLHLPRVEMFLQELARREPLYFQQRAMDEKEPAYAGPGYRDHYYEVLCVKML